MRWMKPLAALSVFAFILAAGCAPKPEETMASGGVSLRPPGAAELHGSIPQNSVYLFENREFGGKVTRIENVTSQPAGVTEKPGRVDDMTSLKWDLPAGVVVVFYENGDGTGNQFPIWGRGELGSVSKWSFNDKVSRWAWYSLGSSANSSASLEQGRIPPNKARPTTNIPSDTIELYSDRDLKGKLETLSPVTGKGPTEYHSAGMVNDQMTSTRWNLPAGVLVVFYDNIDGTGRQLAIWNKGEFETVSPANMNDKVSSWAWYRLGESGGR